MDKKDQELDNCNILVGKINKIKAKAKIQGFASRNIDQECHHGNYLMHTNTAKAKTLQNPKLEKAKVSKSESL